MRDGSDGLPEPQGPCGYQNTNVMQNILYSIVSFRTRHLHSHSHHTSTHDTHARTHVHSCERWRNDGVLHKKGTGRTQRGHLQRGFAKKETKSTGGKSSQKDRLQAHTHGHGVSKFAGEAGVAGVARGSSGRAGAVAAAVAAAAVEQQQQQQLVTRVTRASATATATLFDYRDRYRYCWCRCALACRSRRWRRRRKWRRSRLARRTHRKLAPVLRGMSGQ